MCRNHPLRQCLSPECLCYYLSVVCIVQMCVSVSSAAAHETSVFSCPVARVVARPRQQQQQESRPGSGLKAGKQQQKQQQQRKGSRCAQYWSLSVQSQFVLQSAMQFFWDCLKVLVIQLVFRCGRISSTYSGAYNNNHKICTSDCLNPNFIHIVN